MFLAVCHALCANGATTIDMHAFFGLGIGLERLILGFCLI